MGFLGNMLSEAGKKAGRAIGNSLWGNKRKTPGTASSAVFSKHWVTVC